MFGITATPYDQKVYAEQLADFLPDTIVDLPVHLWELKAKEG